jgi:hypothetical protein
MSDYSEHHSYDDDSYDGCRYCGTYKHDTRGHERATLVVRATQLANNARQQAAADKQGVVGQ